MESHRPSKRGGMAAAAAAEDRLSSLPDDLLLSILRELQLKHVVGTSALSRRWSGLWLRALAASPVLDLADRDFARGQPPASAVATVTRCLRLHAEHGGAPLDAFRVSFPYPPGAAYGRDVVGWVAAAVARGAGEVEVDLTPAPGRRRALGADWGVYSALDADAADFLELPGDMFLAKNSLARLALRRCSLRAVPAGATGLAGLRSLSLSHADVTDQEVRDVLAHCRALEFLSLRSCNLLTFVKVAGEKLRGLELVGCLEMRELYVTAPAIESFVFHGDTVCLCGDGLVVHFRATPVLRDAYLSHLGFGYFEEDLVWQHGFVYYGFLKRVAHATILTICSVGLQHIHATRAFALVTDSQELQQLMPPLDDQHVDASVALLTMDVPNLQELQLQMTSFGDDDVDRISGLFEFIQAPILDRLFIHLPRGKRAHASGATADLAGEEDDGGDVVSDVDLVLDHLTFLKVVNFRGTRSELRLLRFLMNRAPALEQLVLVTLEKEGTRGDEQLEIMRGRVSAMRTASSPETHVSVCRPREDCSRNPAHTRFYHEDQYLL